MPCDYTPRVDQTELQRKREVKAALELLERKLKDKTVTLIVGPTGAVFFKGWKTADRRGISDACAFRALGSKGSFELRQAKIRAEADGRRVNAREVNSGTHSHDGRTWHPGHGKK